MYQSYSYADIKNNEFREATDLISRVFDEFVAPGYSAEGIKTFTDYIQPVVISERINGGNSFMITSKKDDKIVGVIEVRDFNHLALLFVEKQHFNNGIARELFNRAITRCKEKGISLSAVSVNSSPYAVAIYKRLGFKQIEQEKEKNGIRFIHMEALV